MENDNQRLEEGIAQSSEVFGVVHKWNYPRICLGDDEVVDVEENGELIHWEVMTNRPIYKFTIHQGVLLYVAFVVFAVEVSRTIDIGDSATSCRGAPDQDIRSCEIV